MSLYTLEERRVLATHFNELATKLKAMGIVVKDPHDPEKETANFRESVGLLFWTETMDRTSLSFTLRFCRTFPQWLNKVKYSSKI